jgi:hypothetical protein
MEEAKRIFNKFEYQGIFLDAIKREAKVHKRAVCPVSEKYKNIHHYLKPVWDGQNNKNQIINGLQIETHNINIIDIDDPSNCPILDDLLNDCEFIIKTLRGYHFYFDYSDKVILSDKGKRAVQCRGVDINLNRMFYSPSFFDIETGEEYKYSVVKCSKLVELPKYAIVYCNMKITEKNNESTSKQTIKKTYEQKENKIIYDRNKINNVFDCQIMNYIFEIYHTSGLFNNWNDWKNTAYMARHLNNSEECFNLFHEYSKKSEKYKDVNDCLKVFYGNGQYIDNYDEKGILIKCSKLNEKLYTKNLLKLYKPLYEKNINIKINSQYLFTDDNKYIFDEWYKTYKCLMIKSAYGTGKTYAFKQIIENYAPHRILFITYRQSLAFSLFEDLSNKYGFQSYLNKDTDIKKADRLIIQLDSIKRLTTDYNFELQENIINSYDLIVLDEFEGLLNHLSYSKINQYDIYNKLEKLIINSKKILCLDGDLNDRSFSTIHNILLNDYKLVINEYRPNVKNFNFTSDIDLFNNSIDDDLKNSKKIVVICMTKSMSEELNDKYKNKYNVIIHNSDEKNKDILLDVNKNWQTCDLLLYSPTVESGVDFNIVNYFYKAYAYLSNHSTSYRAFYQMLNRVRYYEDNNILLYFDEQQMKYDLFMNPYTYDEFKLVKYQGLELNNIINILIYNNIEEYNTLYFFIPSLIKMIIDKGHIYKLIEKKEETKKEKEESKTKLMIEKISTAKNINEDYYNNLLSLQRQNKDITRDDKYSLLKMYYKRVFLIDDINDINVEFLEEHYNKISNLKNNKLFNIKDDERLINNTEYLKKFKFDKVDYIKKIIKVLQLDNNNIINDEILENGKDEAIKIINSKEYKILFNCKKTDVKKDKFSFNGLFEDYGLKINSTRIRKQINKVMTTTYNYNLINLEFINKYNQRLEAHKEKFKNLGEALDMFLEIE